MASWTQTGDSGANAAVTVTRAAEVGIRHHVTDLTVIVRSAVSGNDVRVEIREGSTVKWDMYFDAKRGVALEAHFSNPITLDTNKDLNVVVAAAGAAAITTVSVGGYGQ